MHQNVKKPKSKAARTVYGPIFLPFYVILVNFFFFCRDAKKTGSSCAIIDCNLSKKHNLALYKTQSGGWNHVDYKFFFNILIEITFTKTWGQTSKYYRMASWLVHALCNFKATWHQEASVSLEYTMKIHFVDTFFLKKNKVIKKR